MSFAKSLIQKYIDKGIINILKEEESNPREMFLEAVVAIGIFVLGFFYFALVCQ